MPQTEKQHSPVRFTIRFTVVSIFVIATLITATIAVGLQYYFSRVVATKVAVAEYGALADSSNQFLKMVDSQAERTVKVLASYPELGSSRDLNEEKRGVFAQIMRNNPLFSSVYLGFEDGSFFELINLESDESIRNALKAMPEDRWVVIRVDGLGAERQRTFEYYDDSFTLRVERHEPSDFVVHQRPWYVQARSGVVNKTAPYMFHALQEPGQTYSTVVQDSSTVVAVDIALSSLSNHLSSSRLSQDSEVYIYQSTGEVIAADTPTRDVQALPEAEPLRLTEDETLWIQENPVISVSNEMDWAPVDFAVSGKPYGYSIDYLSLVSQMTGIRFEYINGFNWVELVNRFRAGTIDVLQPVYRNQYTPDFGIYSDPFVSLPYSLVTSLNQKPITHVRQLDGWTVAIPAGWSIIKALRQHYPQINVLEVESNRAVFQAVLDGRADAGLDVGQILHYTARQFFFGGLMYHDNLDFSPIEFPEKLRFAFHEDNQLLRDLFNRAIAKVTEEQKQALSNKWFKESVSEESLGTVPYEALVASLTQPEKLNALETVSLKGTDYFMYITPFTGNERHGEYFAIVTPVETVLKPALEKVRVSALLTAALLLLLLPIPWIFASPIVKPVKALALENEKIKLRQYDQLHIPRSRIKEIDELGLSIISMAESIQAHEAHQMALMDSFIELIAQAIDDKSPYTAGHCERVPELALMLAQQAHDSTSQPFEDFSFRSKVEWREFRVGAWLHDCGKITTPEHIVDKGSKLEVIYNRIHEVRTRFEVLWRDAEIHYWQQLARQSREGNANLDEVKAVLDKELQVAQEKLRDDFAFVATMNVGGEFMSEDKLERLYALSKIRWTRHFSRRLGLSPQEEVRLAEVESAEEEVLPCSEALLQDRPEHLIPREHETHYDPRLGIKMDIPEYLYNQGELHNLEITRGTLTAEDRFKINEHIISTIRMLDTLPFPKELENVPRYASTHHETLNGTGYPRKLSAEDLSMPERIMVLADVFEALTAADRPYKKAKPVSVAIDILAKLVEDNHVDRDVFELFLTSGVYWEYARRFLSEEQLDEVDIQRYLHQG